MLKSSDLFLRWVLDFETGCATVLASVAGEEERPRRRAKNPNNEPMKPRKTNGVVEYWSDRREPGGAWNQCGEVDNRGGAEPRKGKSQPRTTQNMRTNFRKDDRDGGECILTRSAQRRVGSGFMRAKAARRKLGSGKRWECGEERGQFFPPFPGISHLFPPFPT